MNKDILFAPDGKPRDRLSNRHYCPDETATGVNGRWLCNCPGGPYFYTAKAMREIRDYRLFMSYGEAEPAITAIVESEVLD